MPPDTEGITIEVTDDLLRDAIKEYVLDMSEDLCVMAGYAAGFRGEVYSALMQHIRTKFLAGNTLGLTEKQNLDYAWKMLDQVRTKVSRTPGLVAGIIEYANK